MHYAFNIATLEAIGSAALTTKPAQRVSLWLGGWCLGSCWRGGRRLSGDLPLVFEVLMRLILNCLQKSVLKIQIIFPAVNPLLSYSVCGCCPVDAIGSPPANGSNFFCRHSYKNATRLRIGSFTFLFRPICACVGRCGIPAIISIKSCAFINRD